MLKVQPGSARRDSQATVSSLMEFSVSDLNAHGLKKNIFGKPSPYVKLSIMPSRRHRRSWKQYHGQIAKTSSQSNTINPVWANEVKKETNLFINMFLRFSLTLYCSYKNWACFLELIRCCPLQHARRGHQICCYFT